MNHTLRISCLAWLAFACHANAAEIVNDPIEPDGTWTIGTVQFQYHAAAFGLAPTAGTTMFHMNNRLPIYSGTNSIIYSHAIVPGIYVATLDVGRWNNATNIAALSSIGLTADGRLLAAETISNPTPALGQFRTWRFTYRFAATDTNLGKHIGFEMSAPYTGLERNIAFDNLRIVHYPDFVTSSIHHAAEICWNTDSNLTYQVHWSSSVDATNWFDLGPAIAGTGSNHCEFVSTRFQTARFYRVVPFP